MDPILESFKEALDPAIQYVKQQWIEWQPHIDKQIEGLDVSSEVKQVLRDPTTYIALAGCLLLVFLFVFMRTISPKKRRDAVLLVGPCDAGKTTLFFQLQGASAAGTVASMQENEDTFVLRSEQGKHGRPVHVVDVPGHPRVRGIFERYVDQARGIVFLLDSVTFVPNKTETAEQLYEVLSHPVVISRRLPVLLGCNKADLGVKAHTPEFIRKMLEKELDQICGTRNSLDDGTGSAGAVLRKPGEAFSFEALAKQQGVKVTLASISCLDSEGVRDVETFIRKCVPA